MVLAHKRMWDQQSVCRSLSSVEPGNKKNYISNNLPFNLVPIFFTGNTSSLDGDSSCLIVQQSTRWPRDKYYICPDSDHTWNMRHSRRRVSWLHNSVTWHLSRKVILNFNYIPRYTQYVTKLWHRHECKDLESKTRTCFICFVVFLV